MCLCQGKMNLKESLIGKYPGDVFPLYECRNFLLHETVKVFSPLYTLQLGKKISNYKELKFFKTSYINLKWSKTETNILLIF